MTEVDQKILINVEDDETRIALVHGSTLNNLYIEQTHHTQKVGNIYCGKVVKVQPSFQAAFIDYGEERHGFLSLSDINFQVYKPNQKGRGRPSITQILKPGQKVLVQVVKDEIAHKGASLTTNISLAGRFLVFMPDSERGGVSRKIEDEEQRSRLRHLLKGLGGEDSSAIIRTVGVDRSLTELKRDFMILRRTWNEIKDEYEEQSALGLLYQEEIAMVRMIRDYYHENISEVVIDEPVAFQRALEFFQAHMPKDQKKLQLYLGEKSLFSSYDIEGHIEVLHHKQVPLPSGGSLVIMPTEALVAIDVNSGRSTQERNIEATALRTNLEAAEEVAKQLRLRNLGGLIVVDFIDMDNSKNRLSVEQKIEDVGLIHSLTQTAGAVSLHIPWDIPKDYKAIKELASSLDIKFDAVNSNTFQDQKNAKKSYKYGSLSNTSQTIREQAIAHNIDVIKIGNLLESKALTIWLADGSSFPGQNNFQTAFQNTLNEFCVLLARASFRPIFKPSS